MKNNNLEPVKLPMNIRFGEKPTTLFLDPIASLKIDILHCPTSKDLANWLPFWCNATWKDECLITKEEYRNSSETLLEVLKGKTLPSALETIEVIFSIRNISTQEVTHLLRHRGFSFSAQCTGDRWQTHENVIIPESIKNSEFRDRYEQNIIEAKQLYVDMIDSKEISIMDARYILPRAMVSFYLVKANMKDLLGFLHQRIDRQIQPEVDNAIAYKLINGISEYIPEFAGIFDIDEVNRYYVNTARTGKATNLYFPEEQNDIFEWNEKDFIYQHRRKNSSTFTKLYEYTKTNLKMIYENFRKQN